MSFLVSLGVDVVLSTAFWIVRNTLYYTLSYTYNGIKWVVTKNSINNQVQITDKKGNEIDQKNMDRKTLLEIQQKINLLLEKDEEYFIT